jgi:NAD(P)H-hydrate epimerase
MSGALVMAADAAWRSGCGAVIAHMPKALIARVDANLVQPVKLGYGRPDDDRFTSAHAEEVLARIAAKPGTVLIGPGLGSDSATKEFVRAVCQRTNAEMVIDADALSAIDGLRLDQAILTPHLGELAAMTSRDVRRWSDRLDAVRRLSSDTGATVVSKGQPTAVVSPDGHALITGYSTRPFARMGFGDVLAGKIAAFRSFQLNPADAARNALLAGLAESRHTNDPFPSE